MKLAFSSLLVLTLASTSFALFWAGNRKQNSEQLVRRTDTWNFQKSKCRYVHMNTCREVNIIMDRVEIDTLSGNTVMGKLVHGGEEDFYIVVELCGEGPATYQTTIWGHFRGVKTHIDEPKVFLTFDQFWPCNHPIALY